MTVESSRQIFEKLSNLKYHENPSRGSRVVPCSRDRQDMAKVIVAFHNLRTRLKVKEFSASVIFIWISGVDLRFTLAQDMSGTWKKNSFMFFHQE